MCLSVCMYIVPLLVKAQMELGTPGIGVCVYVCVCDCVMTVCWKLGISATSSSKRARWGKSFVPCY